MRVFEEHKDAIAVMEKAEKELKALGYNAGTEMESKTTPSNGNCGEFTVFNMRMYVEFAKDTSPSGHEDTCIPG